MKYRSDFVTNSSSSSFLLAFHSKEEGLAKIAKLTGHYGASYIGWLIRDFESAEPFTADQILDHYKDDLESDAGTSIDYNVHWSDSDFKRKWLADHPDAKVWEYYSSPERAARVKELVDAEIAKINSDIGDRSYLVDVEYEDHCDIGSELEHYIMPNLDFTVRRFNHH